MEVKKADVVAPPAKPPQVMSVVEETRDLSMSKGLSTSCFSPTTGPDCLPQCAIRVSQSADGPPVPVDNAAAALADRDAVLAKVEMDRKLLMIKAWEESEKSKAENNYHYYRSWLWISVMLVKKVMITQITRRGR